MLTLLRSQEARVLRVKWARLSAPAAVPPLPEVSLFSKSFTLELPAVAELGGGRGAPIGGDGGGQPRCAL
jgi:hypothetical protein